MHTPAFALQAPEAQTAAALPELQGPLPLAKHWAFASVVRSLMNGSGLAYLRTYA